MNVDESALRRIIRTEVGAELDAGLDAKLDARFSAFEQKINLDLARFFGQTNRYLDEKFKKFERKYDKKFDRMQNAMDGLLKRTDDDDKERVAMNAQLNRHEGWIGELAGHTGARLSPP